MNLDLEGYFCPDCGHRVTVIRQDSPMRGTIQFRVAFHHLRYVFEMSDVEYCHHDSVEEEVHHRIRAAIEEIRAKAHPVGQVSYDGILPEGVQFVQLPVYTSRKQLWEPDAFTTPTPKPKCKPAYPPARKILL